MGKVALKSNKLNVDQCWPTFPNSRMPIAQRNQPPPSCNLCCIYLPRVKHFWLLTEALQTNHNAVFYYTYRDYIFTIRLKYYSIWNDSAVSRSVPYVHCLWDWSLNQHQKPMQYNNSTFRASTISEGLALDLIKSYEGWETQHSFQCSLYENIRIYSVKYMWKYVYQYTN